jgi:hypothetical protein
MDIYEASEWHDFFLMVGGGAAALTGLVFVAMSLNLYVIFHDTTHRTRAVGTLSAFVAVFMVCALVLMGRQNHVAVGLEWLVVTVIATYIYVYGYIRARRRGRSAIGLSSFRLAGGTACYIAQIAGSILIILGYVAGLYLAAVAMIIFFGYMISGAWLLLVGVHLNEAERKARDDGGGSTG